MEIRYYIDNNEDASKIMRVLKENKLSFYHDKDRFGNDMLQMRESIPANIMRKYGLYAILHKTTRNFTRFNLSISPFAKENPNIEMKCSLVGEDYFHKSQREVYGKLAKSREISDFDIATAFMTAYIKDSQIPKNKIALDSVEFFSKNKNNTTLVNWRDKTKTVVRCSDNDTDDKEKAFLFAYFQKNSGLNKTQANKLIKEIANGKHLPQKK